MGYIGYGLAAGLGTEILRGQNKTGMGSENTGEFLGTTLRTLAVGGGTGLAMNVASSIIGGGKKSKANILGIAATIAGSAYLNSRF